jgi:hypothetical protein
MVWKRNGPNALRSCSAFGISPRSESVSKGHGFESSMVASAGETDRDLAATQFSKNCVEYNNIELKHYKFKTI